METVISKSVFLNNACKILDIPVIATEQYPSALGNTVPEIELSQPAIPKKTFSMKIPQVQEKLSPEVDTILICGIEAHVCILQTVLDFKAENYRVYVVCDAISSQR